MNKKVKYIIILFILFIFASPLILKTFIIRDRFSFSIEMLMASLNTLAPDLHIENSKIISGPFFNYQIVGDIYNDENILLSKYKLSYLFNNLSKVTLDNTILQTEIFFKYPTKNTDFQDFSSMSLSDNFVAYISLKEFYSLENFLSKYNSDSIVWFVPNSTTSKNYYENGLRSKAYCILGFNSDIFDSVWKSSLKSQGLNTLIKEKVIQKFPSYTDFLEQNFIETLKFLYVNSESNYYKNYTDQLYTDIEYFENTGIDIFGIIIKDDNDLLLKMIEDNIVSYIELKKQ